MAERSKARVCVPSLDGIAGSNPTGGRNICLLCVLSGRGLCDRPIARPEESYRLWCVLVCDQCYCTPLHLPWARQKRLD